MCDCHMIAFIHDDPLAANGSRQKGAFRAVASQKKICLLEHQNAFAAIQSTFIGIIFVTILLEISPGCNEESQQAYNSSTGRTCIACTTHSYQSRAETMHGSVAKATICHIACTLYNCVKPAASLAASCPSAAGTV